MQHTLSTIQANTGATKRTVQAWLQKATAEHGEIGCIANGARVFTDREYAIVIGYQGPKRSAPPVIQAEIVCGNHRVIQDAPIVPTQFDLSRFRGDQDSVSIADPLAVVDRVAAIVAGVKGAMQADLAQQRAQIAQTEQAIDLLDDQAQILRDEALAYRIESNATTQQQTQATQRLEAKVGKLQALSGGGAPPGR